MDNLTDEMRIACCKCCLLSQAMKDCKVCPFRIGLVYKALREIKAVPVEYPIELRITTLERLKSLI